MLQRNRSISLPKYAGDIVFQAESDFHADVYDDTADDTTFPLDMKTPPVISKDKSKSALPIICKLLATMSSGSVSSVFYMMLLKEDPGTSLLAAFVLHLCVIVVSLPVAGQFILTPKIPYHRHAIIVMLSFGFVYLKSYAVQMLPMPIIFVMSNLQLVIGLFVGKFLFFKKFSFGQHCAVVLISIGCIMQTLPSLDDADEANEGDLSVSKILIGIALMGASMLSMSIMIPYGSKCVQQYDANVQEQLFMQHFLSMPLFAMQYEKIGSSLKRVCSGDSYFEIAGILLPVALVLLMATSFLGQVNRNLSMELSLDVGAMASQLVNTLNKTITLFISLFFFNTSATSSTMYEIIRNTSCYIWGGVFIQTFGSVWYVQSSYSENSTSTFRPSKSAHRLSRVSFTGETKLGLSTDDISRLRMIAAEHRRSSLPNLTQLVEDDEVTNDEVVPRPPSPCSNVRKRRVANAGQLHLDCQVSHD